MPARAAGARYSAPPWAAFDCGSRYALYNAVTRKWHTIRCDTTCRSLGYWVSTGFVGKRWLALYVQPHSPCPDNIHNDCGPATFLYYDVITGRPRIPRLGANQFIDLDAASLTRMLCRPLTLPADTSAFGPGLITSFGPFVLGPWPYIGRCGSGRRISLTGSAAEVVRVANRQAIMFFLNLGPRVVGVWLPSLRRFTFKAPPGIEVPYVLGARHLFLTGQRGGLWEAAFPPVPPQ